MIRNSLRIAGIACLLVFTAVYVVHADDSSDHHWAKSWNVAAAPEVEIRADRGSIRIVQGDANSVHATVDASYWAIGPDVQVTDSLDGNHLEIRVRTPKEDHRWFHFHSAKVEIEIDVPSGSKLNLRTGFGDLTSTQLRAHADLSTGFGKVRLSDYDGDLRAETGFGDLNVNGRFDDIQLKTGFGDVRASINSGSRISDDWEFSSGFGDVRVNLPRNMNASLSEDSGFGGVSSDFPLADASEHHHSHLRSVIGSGGPLVRATTGFGSVHIGRT